VKEARLSASLSEEKRKTKILIERVVQLEKELGISQALKNSVTHYKIPVSKTEGTEAVAVMVASDWHIEETVLTHQVSGLNEFNEHVCKERVRRFFQHGLKLIQKEQKAAHIDTLILAVLGDMISGSIHEELLEGNRISPTYAIMEAQEHLISGIRYLLAHSNLNIIVPCNSGNHGRFTPKTRISTEAGNSLERLMYHALSQVFANEPRVKFVVSDGYHTYVKVFDTTIRFHHGHAVKYGGGVGGITIPINKAIAGWNKGRKADIDVMGHFHQLFDGGNFIVNGSLIGYNAFALSIKASPEPPQQAFFLVDKTYGKTVSCPIILTEDR
jgi:hypothetical protein